MRKDMTNQEIAELLRSVAAAYELKPQSEQNIRFRITAYQRAADAVEHATSELKDLWEEGKLDQIPGVGSSIAQHLDELFKTGNVRHFHAVFSNLPPAMFTLLRVPGIGAKTAFKLTRELKITSRERAIEELEKAAKNGAIRTIAGFGADSENDILRSIEEIKGRTDRMLLPYATVIAEEVVEWLKKHPFVKRVDPLGSLRRQVATVGDVDIAVASDKSREVIEHFGNYPKKSHIIEAGEHTSSLVLPGGAHIDLMVQPPEAYGALLQHFTGSKHHNIALREYALKKKMSLSEYGIKKLKTSAYAKALAGRQNSKLKTFATEEDFYKELDLLWIPPELREDTGEIEAALRSAQGKLPGLPKLVELSDIKGDFHLHSSFPIKTSHDEGQDSFEKMVKRAGELGYEYLGFSEHNPSQSTVSKKEAIELLESKSEAIEQINYSMKKSEKERVRKVFNGLEIDILPNGKLAIPEEGLEFLDYAIVSIHSSFRQSKKEQTKRVIAGLSHPKAKILGHPTARRLQKREGIELEWEEIFAFCKKHEKALEVNSWYDRLDLSDILVREAVKHGVKLIINTDSHEVSHMELMRYGVSVARRGWAEKGDVVNTWDWTKFVSWFTMK
ncbi:hypothetical protein HY405_02230 [Candidatus Microgenomates bacterium]|nr:hypothetical protein [Candidatus Microgenomates bacterium]